MKKIFLILLLLTGILFSCSKKIEVYFEISSDIEIELEDYNANYNFSPYIKCYKDGESVPYQELVISLKEGTSVQLGECIFYVSYTFKETEYKQEFKVLFKDSSSIVEIHYGDRQSTYEIENGKPLSSLDLPASVTTILGDNMKVDGYYLDSSYKTPFDSQSIITNDKIIYAKLTFDSTYVPREVDTDLLVEELDEFIETLIEQTDSFYPSWNKEGFKGRWNYIDGVFLNSIINLYKETNKVGYKNFFLRYIDYYIDSNGNFINPEKKTQDGYRSGELDSVCASRILFDAYEMTKDERYLTAIETTYSELMKMPLAKGTVNYSHKTSYLNQIWLDGMYMYVPFLARYAQMKEDQDTFNLIKQQYEYIRNHMFDEQKKLYYHGHDTTKSVFWADSNTGNSQSFWLRSNGWFIVSLVDVLEYYPEGENKAYLKNLLNEALEGIMQYKDSKTNLFYQLVDQGPTAFLVKKEYLDALKNHQYGNAADTTIKNYLESSGSSMIAYASLKSSKLGYTDSKYEEIGIQIFEGIYDYSFEENTLHNICITAGLGPEKSPYRDGSPAYYLAEPVGLNDAKGVGPFFMAYIEYAKAKNKLKQYYNIHQIYMGIERDISYVDEIESSQIMYQVIPGYIFKGFYYDKDFNYPLSSSAIISGDIIVYGKYVNENE